MPEDVTAVGRAPRPGRPEACTPAVRYWLRHCVRPARRAVDGLGGRDAECVRVALLLRGFQKLTDLLQEQSWLVDTCHVAALRYDYQL